MNDLMRLVASSRPARLDEDPGTRTDPGPIMAHPQRPLARPRSRRRLLVATALAVTGAVVVGGIAARPAGPRPQPTATGTYAPATARALLLAASDQIVVNQAGGRYWRIVAENGESGKTVVTDTWLPTDPSAREVVVMTAPGHPRAIKTAPAGAGLRLGGSAITMKQLAALPADPAALRKSLLARLDTTAEGPADYLLFVAGEILVTDLPVRPAVRAATYRMLADLPEVRLLGAVRDQRGRSGVAVGYPRNGSESRLILDPAGGQALARESWHGGTLLSYQATLTAVYTNEEPPTR